MKNVETAPLTTLFITNEEASAAFYGSNDALNGYYLVFIDGITVGICGLLNVLAA
ncbi:hypothetical protein DSECCO2_577470 [anaerobic digester metagenome]